MNEILAYLKIHGELRDTEIAAAMGFALDETRLKLAQLAAKNEVMLCQSTRFEKGKKIETMICRISGLIPKSAPGRKSTRVNLQLS